MQKAQKLKTHKNLYDICSATIIHDIPNTFIHFRFTIYGHVESTQCQAVSTKNRKHPAWPPTATEESSTTL